MVANWIVISIFVTSLCPLIARIVCGCQRAFSVQNPVLFIRVRRDLFFKWIINF